MSPTAMLTLMFAAFAMFTWSASRRWRLLQVGQPANRLDHIAARARGTWRYAFRQEKMDYYNPAGIAHKLIFTGFVLLNVREMILWGRGYYPPFNMWIFGPGDTLGPVFEFSKDLLGIGTLIGTSVFFYYRVILKPKRMALTFEGLLIIGIISTLMLTDMGYDGTSLVLNAKQGALCDGPTHAGSAGLCASIATIIAPLQGENWLGWSAWPAPAGSFVGTIYQGLSPETLVWLAHGLLDARDARPPLLEPAPALEALPHHHGDPERLLPDLEPARAASPMARERREAHGEGGRPPARCADPTMAAGRRRADRALHVEGDPRLLHVHRVRSLLGQLPGAQDRQDPAPEAAHARSARSPLRPRERARRARDGPGARSRARRGAAGGRRRREPAERRRQRRSDDGANGTKRPRRYKPIDLVPDVIHPDVLWACTTCRACEEQCPVMISYVDKIVDMRRNLVMVKGEFPPELAEAVPGRWRSTATRGTSRAWIARPGPTASASRRWPRSPTPQVLYWVGCAASYDDRAKKIARATAKLLKHAGVDFAILGQEETCTGDPARRAGNEFLFAMLAEGNAATLNGYKEQGGMQTIVTTCPHCFNTLKNEYPDFGAKLEVVHHTDFLLGLVAERKLVPKKPVDGRVVYHDTCYLGRYNDVYESPREILKRIPASSSSSPSTGRRQRASAAAPAARRCGWRSRTQNRVNVKRTLQLVDTGAKTIASACPFCMTMLTDGLKSKSLEERIKQLDVVELLERSCEAPLAVPEIPPEAPVATTAPAEATAE